jgi:hypothetical protein
MSVYTIIVTYIKDKCPFEKKNLEAQVCPARVVKLYMLWSENVLIINGPPKKMVLLCNE